MGWNSASRIFDPVATALQKANADDNTKRTVLSGLIRELQDGDWDTEDESLEDFLDDPAIVSAFADRNVHLSDRRCCARELDANPRQVLLAMRNEDVSEEAMVEALDAYASHLARTLRACKDEVRLSTLSRPDIVAWAADVIDPQGHV
ncbi:hypothetical protein DCW30_05720 [Streptomyces alfalfae]|uniref:Uncharacterized protein n=1 Tax=Streptomyces alfalfae TaxID=1642299 RepID=A0ABM6GWS0_9ACTN|nr:hypothetical protein [Streptomyces alfalfae]APY88200.1 hypothetical protein A7J05_23150 [Streptomyces alfalfae]AYA18596.1 hypothetical protein D3X13_22265 [Streptomyces fradiae]RXX46523.1 hypothetical protein DCW30_05720 [Streptomyces alfalfae]RZM90036.1 hypothetical protein D4104_25655 [Streptomyces alfalfae]